MSLKIKLILKYLSNRKPAYYRNKMDAQPPFTRMSIAYARIIADAVVKEETTFGIPTELMYLAAYFVADAGYKPVFSYNKDNQMYCLTKGAPYGQQKR